MKTFTKITLFAALITTLAACNSSANDQMGTSNEYPRYMERNSSLSNSPEWEPNKQKMEALYEKIKIDTANTQARLQLAQLYMQEARITGEHPYYYPAALTILNDVITRDPQSFEAHALKASVLLSLHHFEEAKEIGEMAVALNPNNGFIYGVLCDANVELGNYDAAVAMSDKMQVTRPGLESYSRASYLREIYGDNAGAIEAMKMAFQSGMPGSEEASWAGNVLAQLYMNIGDYENAMNVSRLILAQRPSYAFSTDAIGRIYMAKGQTDSAIAYYTKAIAVMPEFSFYEHLAEAYKAKGKNEKYHEIYKSIVPMLEEDAKSGHYMDLELATVYLKLGDKNKALKHVKIEHRRRPNNIDVNAKMAKVYLEMGNPTEAQKHMEIAMRTGKRNSEWFMQSASIEKSLGNDLESAMLKSKAKQINPLFS